MLDRNHKSPSWPKRSNDFEVVYKPERNEGRD